MKYEIKQPDAIFKFLMFDSHGARLKRVLGMHSVVCANPPPFSQYHDGSSALAIEPYAQQRRRPMMKAEGRLKVRRRKLEFRAEVLKISSKILRFSQGYFIIEKNVEEFQVVFI